MDYVPLLREAASVFNVPTGPTTDASMNSALRKLAKYTYIFIAVVIVFGVPYVLINNLQRPIAGILFFLGAVIAAYYYYVKWFLLKTKDGDWPNDASVSISGGSLCPDYLTPIFPEYTTDPETGLRAPKQNSTVKCVDFIGVSQNGFLKVANPADIQSQINNPQYFFPIKSNMKPAEVKAQLDLMGLSWLKLFGDEPARS